MIRMKRYGCVMSRMARLPWTTWSLWRPEEAIWSMQEKIASGTSVYNRIAKAWAFVKSWRKVDTYTKRSWKWPNTAILPLKDAIHLPNSVNLHGISILSTTNRSMEAGFCVSDGNLAQWPNFLLHCQMKWGILCLKLRHLSAILAYLGVYIMVINGFSVEDSDGFSLSFFGDFRVFPHV